MSRSIPIQRYAGSVIAFGAYGRPTIRPAGRAVALIAFALGLLGIAWAAGIDFGPGLFLAGPVTLAQASLNAESDIDRFVIDEFRKTNALLEALTFDDAVNPVGGGATLTYGYTRLITQPTAAFRAINSEYSPQEVTKQQYTVDLKVLGGAFQIDRVLNRIAAGAETALQTRQKVKATQAKFNDTIINGDSAVDANGFDGLSKALAGSTTELYAGGPATDWTGTSEDAAFTKMDAIDELLALLDGPATILAAHARVHAKIRAAARRAGYWTRERTEFGLEVERYGNVILLDPGKKPGTNDDVLPIRTGNEVNTVTITGTPTGGSFTLTVNGETTAPIAYNANAAAVETALEALASIDDGDVAATGGALPGTAVTLTWGGRYAGVNIPTITADGAGLTGGTDPAVAVATTTQGGASTGASGVTDVFAIRLGLDGFHGVSTVGAPLIQQYPPDFDTPGAVKTGEVEMGPVAVALKATKAAAVLRNVRV